jgi:EAL domain-containing protein (putative c-di-GMP-specific phosphodiesterase class I)
VYRAALVAALAAVATLISGLRATDVATNLWRHKGTINAEKIELWFRWVSLDLNYSISLIQFFRCKGQRTVKRQQSIDTMAAGTNWVLLERNESDGSTRLVNVNDSPFRIGRLPNLSLSLTSSAVSKLHAELVVQSGRLMVRDLGSTNGTFVNGRRIAELTPLEADDLLQLASEVFRVGRQRPDSCMRTIRESAVDLAHALCQFDYLMSHRAVVPHFQPIVSLQDQSIIGFEALGRSSLPGFEQPRLMFAAAEKLDQQCALSEMLLSESLRVGVSLPGQPNLFVNTHPSEVVTARLIDSIKQLRIQYPGQRLTIEIHESAATDLRVLVDFGKLLHDLGMHLAFDDFGAGHARLLELTETSPDYVKFDVALVRAIDRASPRRQQTLGALVRMVRELGIATLAEGIETTAEAAACKQLGFELGQGFYFGRPAPLCHYVSFAR